jgi:hypothetical protein
MRTQPNVPHAHSTTAKPLTDKKARREAKKQEVKSQKKALKQAKR